MRISDWSSDVCSSDLAFPGISLLDIAQGSAPQRTVLSEYHGMGSTTGAFMIRNGRFKYVHYAKYRPQLFDLDADPEELRDLAEDPAYREVLRDCEDARGRVCDPDAGDRAVNARHEIGKGQRRERGEKYG